VRGFNFGSSSNVVLC